MLWCDKCKCKYPEGTIKCTKCGSELVEEFEPEDGEAFLITVRDDMNAKIIEAKLNAYDVPTLKKYRGVGSYLTVYMGGTIFGIDIYVPAKLLDKAMDLISEDSTV